MKLNDADKIVIYGLMSILIIIFSYQFVYAECIDSDGFDIYTKGNITFGDGYYHDYCLGDLFEANCDNVINGTINGTAWTRVPCQYGCEDNTGRCTSQQDILDKYNITLPVCETCPTCQCESCSCGGGTKTIYKNNTIIEYKYLESQPKCECDTCPTYSETPVNDTVTNAITVETGKPFYKDVWFYVLVSLIAIVFIWIGFKLSFRKGENYE